MLFRMLIATFVVALLAWSIGCMRAFGPTSIPLFWLGLAGVYFLPILIAPHLVLIAEANFKLVAAAIIIAFLWCVLVAIQVRLMFSGPMFGGRVSPLAALGAPLILTCFLFASTVGVALLMREAGVRTTASLRFTLADLLCLSAIVSLLAATVYWLG